MPAKPLFDFEALSEALAAFGTTQMADIVQQMSDSALTEIEQLRRLVAAGDLVHARRLLHGLVGAASSCAAIRLAADARMVEMGDEISDEDLKRLNDTAIETNIWVKESLPYLIRDQA